MKKEDRGRISLYDTAKVSREEWLELRRTGIGGSDAAVIAGLSRFRSEFELWADKKGKLPEKEPTEAMRIGVELEDYVARRWMEETGKKCIRRGKMFGNRNYPWALANIDREVRGENAGLECKTTNPFSDYDFDGGEVPPWYYAQCVHYMAVCGFDKMYLAVLVLGKGFYHYEIRRDEAEIKALMDAEKEWWEAHIVKDVMPTPDGSEGAGEALKSLFPKPTREESTPLYGADGDLEEYERLGAEIKELEKRREAAKQRVELALGDSARGESQRYRVSWAEVRSRRIDSRKLKEEQPGIYERYSSETVYRAFKAKKIS